LGTIKHQPVFAHKAFKMKKQAGNIGYELRQQSFRLFS